MRPKLFSPDVENAIDIVENSSMAYSHFISKWEVSSNARAFYIPPYAWNMFFAKKGGKGVKHLNRKIRWQQDRIITNKIYYYESKREYRIADFGRSSFEFLQDKYIGSLLIIAKTPGCPYDAYVLVLEKDINDFMDFYRLDSTQPVHCIKGLYDSSYNKTKLEKIREIVNLYESFPTTADLCSAAQDLIIGIRKYEGKDIIPHCDDLIKDWYDADFRIFEGIEEKLYQPYLISPIGELNSLGLDVA